ncbi:MAG TPA: hypothetical protein VGB37_14615 [Candidatus Lokiarchaeia archaeon]
MFWKKKEELSYPIPCGIVDFTEVAKLKNISDEPNKEITIYAENKYGNVEKKRYKYNEARVFILEKKGIPIYDKTKQIQRFEVIDKRDLNEVVYTK